jgi:hypothetical protein
MRPARWVLAGSAFGLSLALALAGCGGGGSNADDEKPSDTPSASEAVTAPETSPTVTESNAAPINMQGNAATNPACKLLTLDQVQTAAGLDVIGMLGLPADTTNPDKHSESCTWFLDPKVVQSSLVVQYTTYGTRPADVIAYYPQVIDGGFATAVPKLGTVSKINGHVLDTIYKRTEIHVTLLTHAEATAADQAATIGLMRIVMVGIKQ